MRNFHSGPAALFAATLYTQTAAAHTGVHEISGFAAGFVHPFLGLDHTLAMLAVGLWAVLIARRGRSVVALPLLFMAGMLLGGGLGVVGLELPYLETAIALSVVALGALILARKSWSLGAAGALVVLFAALHGYAHGLELAETATFAGYALGFTLATGLLHLAGIALGWTLLRSPKLCRVCGGAIGAAGLVLLVQTFQ
jgi:urease accessory protein